MHALDGRDEEVEVPGILDGFTLENQNAAWERKELIQKRRKRGRESFRVGRVFMSLK